MNYLGLLVLLSLPVIAMLFLVGLYLRSTAIIDIRQMMPFNCIGENQAALYDFMFDAFIPLDLQRRYLDSLYILSFAFTSSFFLAIYFDSAPFMVLLGFMAIANIGESIQSYRRFKKRH